MNGYERMKATLNKEKVDHTPSMEIMIDDSVVAALTNNSDYMDLCDLLDLDAVVTNTPSLLYRNEVIDASKGVFKNEWGTVRQKGKEVVSSIIEEPIKTVEDVYKYVAPDPTDEYRFTQLRELIGRFKGERLVGMHIHDSFNYPYYLMGMENLFITMFEEPKAVERLVEISIDHNIEIAKKAAKIGADFIVLGDDYGGGNQLLVSPVMFKQFFLPGLAKIVSEIKNLGMYCFKHCCGDINEIVDDMVKTGIDVLHPLDPSANMDIVGIKNTYKDLVVMGGINCYEPLCEFSESEIAAETKRAIETIGTDGRYIIASSNSVHSYAKPENYLTMQNVRRETPVIYTY